MLAARFDIWARTSFGHHTPLLRAFSHKYHSSALPMKNFLLG
jgi:hypothetical protein